ncbi:hypothetical protein VTP01DRAFT_1437 [Rhizomucor pusillus]|uniref:uncharacterized protein n=1 Tax=Rhizomucor pusillus TaxID=4840 RepID=UPI0037430E87
MRATHCSPRVDPVSILRRQDVVQAGSPQTPSGRSKSQTLLTLNVNWFQPFDKSGPYSCGAIYLVIDNLLRSECFKKQNVHLGW